MNFHFSVTYNRAKEKSDRGMEAESHFRQFAKITQLFVPLTGENTHENTDSILDFAAFVTQKVYMLLNRRGIPTMLKRTQNHKEAFRDIATRIEL